VVSIRIKASASDLTEGKQTLEFETGSFKEKPRGSTGMLTVWKLPCPRPVGMVGARRPLA
jgi:hypothetical protein